MKRFSLKEVKAPDGYRTNNNELIFQVDESGKTEFLSEVNTEEGEVIIEYTEDGIAVVTIEDKPACYKIELKKENEKGVALAGAEFTLYELTGILAVGIMAMIYRKKEQKR